MSAAKDKLGQPEPLPASVPELPEQAQRPKRINLEAATGIVSARRVSRSLAGIADAPSA